ncbi:uncharacterized protein LOC129750837 [Uranotaenia lowii]|uniref:uncharacterized protein LOC129750837 n=1 Tax=Uranotaenia lowii TaxID=190385 RepID=UPI00247A627A|nr:uncharacterized protein LOC129750837 [Uranotaenia lowii]
MNCSCTADRCPHVQYIRALLETTEKDQIYAARQPGCKTCSQHLKTVGSYLWSVIKILFTFWLLFTRTALLLWLRILDSNKYFWIGFLFFALALLASMPGVNR